MAVRAQAKGHQPVMLRFEEGIAPQRGGPPLGAWQDAVPTQPAIEGTFPKPIIQQGLAAFQRSKVRSLNLRRCDIVATVADTETHTTTLTRDPCRLPLGMRCNCTCRYGYDCKHAVAALYTMMQLAVEPEQIEAAPVEAAAGNGAPAAQAARAGGNGPAMATPAARADGAPSDFFSALSQFYESVAPRRRLWVIVGFDDRLGIFYAYLRLDAPKLHGVSKTYADLQQQFRQTRQATFAGEEWDRHDADLLSEAALGPLFGTPADYALARPTREQTQRLSSNFAKLLLHLIGHPRLRYDDHLGTHPAEMQPLSIELAPLRLRLSGARGADGDLELSATFARPDCTTVDCSSVRVIEGTPAWLFDGAAFYPHDMSFPLRMIELFKTASPRKTAAAEIPKELPWIYNFFDRPTLEALMLPPDQMRLQVLARLNWQHDGLTAKTEIEDAASGTNWPVTPHDFQSVKLVEDPKAGRLRRYAICEAARAEEVRAELLRAGFLPWRDVIEKLQTEHPELGETQPPPGYDETLWRLEGTELACRIGTKTFAEWQTKLQWQLDPQDDITRSLVDGPEVLRVKASVGGDGRIEKGKVAAKVAGRGVKFGKINWLDTPLELALEVDGELLTAEECKKIWESSGDFCVLGNRVIDVSSFARLREAASGCEGKLKLTKARALFLHDDLAHAAGEETLPPEMRQFVKDFEKVEEVGPPPHLEKILRPYQREGLHFLAHLAKWGVGGILADDMGLGKTLQVLSYVELQRQKQGCAPNLIVCPTSVTHTWISEAARFTPKLKTVLLSAGSGRETIYESAKDYDLLVTSYALARRDSENIESFKKIGFRTIVLDEAQQIKNPQAKISQVIKNLEAEQRFALTGTPIENSVLDLWSILNFVEPDCLGHETHFRNKFEIPIMRDGDAEKQQRLAKGVSKFIKRRLKSEVAADLPARTEQTIECEMTSTQRRQYRETLQRARRDILREVDEHGIARAQISILAALTKLRQICCHPGLVESSWREDEDASGKFAAFKELVDSIIDSGHRVLVFSSFTQMLGIMREALDAINRGYAYLDGSTKNRQKVLDDFRREDGPPVFLMSLKAGGVGLTVTEADYVILYDPWWNPAIERQAIDRTHRIGQTKPVTAYRLVTLGSVEEKIQALQSCKQALADSIIASDAAFAKSLTREDLEELLAPVGD